MELKEKLAELRNEQGMTQVELAEALGVSRQTISKWERGMAEPSAANLACMGKLYGIPLDQLVNEMPPRQENPAPACEPPMDAPPEARTASRRSVFSRRVWAAVLAGCVLLAGLAAGLAIGAAVAKEPEKPEDGIVWTGAMEWDWIDLSAITQDEDILPLVTGTINTTVSPLSTKTIKQVSLQSRSIITFNCSCSLLSADMDFGVIDTSGRFYFINVKGGSINQAIGISQAGTYQMAVRSNSSQTVRVVGFVND